MTPSPTASTMPANSVPSTVTLGRKSPAKKRMMSGFPARYPRSVRFTVVACTCTSNSP